MQLVHFPQFINIKLSESINTFKRSTNKQRWWLKTNNLLLVVLGISCWLWDLKIVTSHQQSGPITVLLETVVLRIHVVNGLSFFVYLLQGGVNSLGSHNSRSWSLHLWTEYNYRCHGAFSQTLTFPLLLPLSGAAASRWCSSRFAQLNLIAFLKEVFRPTHNIYTVTFDLKHIYYVGM